MSTLNWVGEMDIGIPAQTMYVVVFTATGYVALCGCIHILFMTGVEPAPPDAKPWQKIAKNEQFWCRLILVILGSVVGVNQIETTCGRNEAENKCDHWHVMFWYTLFLIVTASISTTPYEFYLGEGINFVDTMKHYLLGKTLPDPQELEDQIKKKYSVGGSDLQGIGFWTLMPSAFISWIFAKSIRNSSVLGGRFGMMGGFAYTSWYLSFFSTAIVCYILRTKYNFKSLPTAICKFYGPLPVFLFQLCLLFRLFNEVWSNATVIGGFFGASGSSGYWGACWFSCVSPAIYVLMGGMRSSLFSDVFQAALAIVFLIVVLGVISSDSDFSGTTNAFSFEPQALWGGQPGWQPGWWACFLGGTIQGTLSYPFFDPVLTDRAFLGTPKVMLASLSIGGLIAALFIFFYAVIGVYGAWAKEFYIGPDGICGGGCDTFDSTLFPDCPTEWNPCNSLGGAVGEASNVARILGERTFRGAEMFIMFVMITASLSTLDSTFTSASKLVSLEFGGWLHLAGDTRSFVGPLKPMDTAHIGKDHIVLARIFIVVLVIVGNCFLGYEKDAMKATTIAGTSIMGIGPPIWCMCFWKVKTESRKGWVRAPLAFLVPWVVGWVFGISYFLDGQNKSARALECAEAIVPLSESYCSELGFTYDLQIGSYEQNGADNWMYYARFFGTNLVGHAVVIVLFFIFFAFHQLFPKLWFSPLEEIEVEPDEGSVIGIPLPAWSNSMKGKGVEVGSQGETAKM